MIAQAASAADVSRVVIAARETGLELADKSGGHSTTDGGIVLDLSGMEGLHIDADRRTARAQTGLTAGEHTKAADVHGPTTGFGDTGSVGITLGGRIGYLVRKHGLTIDDLLVAEIVAASRYSALHGPAGSAAANLPEPRLPDRPPSCRPPILFSTLRDVDRPYTGRRPDRGRARLTR